MNAGTLLTINTLIIYEKPWYRGRAGTHWIIAEEPSRSIGEGDLVCLTANGDRRTGVGKISQLSGLDKHWATFSIAGAIPKSGIRIPIVWARLTPRAAEAHDKLYLTLENIPPHHALREDSRYRNPHVNPYYTAARPNPPAAPTPPASSSRSAAPHRTARD